MKPIVVFLAVGVVTTALYFYLRSQNIWPSLDLARTTASTPDEATGSGTQTVRPPQAPQNDRATAGATDLGSVESSEARTRSLARQIKGGRSEAALRGVNLKKAREQRLAPGGKFDGMASVRGTTGEWKMVPGLWALPENSEKMEAASVVHRGIGHVFLKLGPDASPPEGSLPAVYDPRRGSFGILSGGLLVSLKTASDASAVAREYSLRFIEQHESIGLTSFKSTSRDGDELARILTSMTSDARVREAKLEVYDRQFSAQ